MRKQLATDERMLQPVLVTVQGMVNVDWSTPLVMQCVGPRANVLLNVLWVDMAPLCKNSLLLNEDQ